MYNQNMARKQGRTISPKFILFCASVFILVIAVVILVFVVTLQNNAGGKEKSSGCSKSRDSISFAAQVENGGQQITDHKPVEEKTEVPTEAVVIPDPAPFPDDAAFDIDPVDDAKPAKFGFTYEVRKNNRDDSYTSNPDENAFSFGRGADYTEVKGITTFAGNNYRNGFAYGNVKITMQNMEQAWTPPGIGSANGFAGASWTGQPLVVTWEGQTLKTLGVRDEFKAKDCLNEIILCAADGNIYFYELETGNRTRDTIAINAPMFGTPTLDPRGIPMLYIGQGTVTEPGTNRSSTFAVNLCSNTFETIVSGKDYTSRRSDWSAFDSSPLIIEDTLIWPSESGVLYLVELHTSYNAETGDLSIRPGDRIKYRYTGSGYASTTQAGKRAYGYESSVAAFRNYLYLTDNGGYLQCVDLNTLKLKFVTDVGGDSDATPVLEENGDDGTVYVYTVSQTDQQDPSLPQGYGYCYVRKIDAKTGRIVWEQKQFVQILDPITGKSMRGGGKGTPHVGHGTIGDLLICNFYGLSVQVTNGEGGTDFTYGGKIIAFDRKTGAIRWEITQTGNADFISSPLVVYNERGDAYLIACDRDGLMRLYDAAHPGENALCSMDLGERIDATPVAFNSYIVVATAGTTEQTRLFCLKLS